MRWVNMPKPDNTFPSWANVLGCGSSGVMQCGAF